MEANDTQLLICPNCWKEIPNFIIDTNSPKIIIKIQCKCSNETMEMDLASYVNTLKTLPSISSKCNECCKEPGFKYCIDCFKWYCNSCLNNHNKTSSTHIHLISSEINVRCKEHNKKFSSYCSQCDSNICVECRKNHYQHEMMRFDTIDCAILKEDLDQIDYFLEMNLNTKETLISQIEINMNNYATLLEQYCGYKEMIIDAFEKHSSINHAFKKFITMIYSTASTLQQYPINAVNNLVNSIHLVFEPFELNLQSEGIESQIKEYHNYLQSKTIVKQKQKYSCITTLTDHTKSVQALIDLDNDLMASCSWDKSIKIWNYKAKKCIATLIGHEHIVQCLAYLNDGKLASGSWDEKIKIWDMKKYECVTTISGHLSYVWCMIQLKNGLLASGSWDKTVRLWEIDTGTSKGILSGNENYILCLVQLIDERLAGSGDCNITIWNLKSMTTEQILKGHEDNVWSLIQLYDGRLVSGSADEKILYWDLQSGKSTMALTEHTNSILEIHQLGKDKLVSCSSDETIKIWDLNTEKSIETLTDHKSTVRSVIRLSNGYLASCSDDKTIKLYGIK